MVGPKPTVSKATPMVSPALNVTTPASKVEDDCRLVTLFIVHTPEPTEVPFTLQRTFNVPVVIAALFLTKQVLKLPAAGAVKPVTPAVLDTPVALVNTNVSTAAPFKLAPTFARPDTKLAEAPELITKPPPKDVQAVPLYPSKTEPVQRIVPAVVLVELPTVTPLFTVSEPPILVSPLLATVN